MKEIFVSIWKAILKQLKALDWRDLLYNAIKNRFLPMIKEKVENTESKWDDMAYQGLVSMNEAFLKPEKVVALPPAT